MQFLKRLFGRINRVQRARLMARLAVEPLEARDVPSCTASAAASAANFGAVAHFGSASTDTGVLKSSTSHSLTASLTGITGAAGTATFTSDASAGTNSFVLSVSGLTASQTYSVEVDGTSIGTVTTDATGKGSVTLTNLTAAVASGSVVTVVDTSTTPGTTALSGTLGESDGCHHTLPDFVAPLTGATGTSGHSSFSANTTAGTNSLAVSVHGLTASSTYTVEIGATTVGTLTTDANGNGKATFSNITATIAAGATITILDVNSVTVLSGTFAVPTHSTTAYFRHAHHG